MTGTEIAIRDNGVVAERDVVDGWLAVASDVIKLANHIADTDFVPEVYRGNPPAVAAAILAGRELALGPMTSLRHVQVVKGSPSLSAEYKRARVLAAGHELEIEEITTVRCKVRGRRAGTAKWLEITFTIEDARKAGLIKDKGAWVTRPRRMLFARATSEICDFLFSDVVNGLPTAELLIDGVDSDEFAGYDEPPADPKQQRTAQRRQRTPARSEAPDPVEPSGSSEGPAAAPTPPTPVSPAGSGPSQPLLPGEDEDPPARQFDPDAPGTATVGQGGQLTALWTTLQKDFAFTSDEKDQARAVCEHIVSRDLGGTTGSLSFNEARTCLDTLANWKSIAVSQERPPREVLIEAMVGAEGEADDAV